MKTTRNKTNIKVYNKIGKDVEKLFRSTIAALKSISKPLNGLECHLVPAPSVSVGSGYGFGVFVVRKNFCMIAIAGKYSNEMKTNGLSRRDWLASIPETIVHEWAHMEQWRDGVELSHKGIDKRTKELLVEILKCKVI